MAVTLQKRFSVDLGSLANEAVASVKKVRAIETTRVQTAFFDAVANGMSYTAQVAYLQQAIDRQNKSPLKDADFIATLTKQLTDTKKLQRFDNYRTKYLNALNDLKEGKDGVRSQLDTLKSALPTITDDDLRQEVLTEIGNLEISISNHDQTMIGNQVKKAMYDGTKGILQSTINTLQDQRGEAAIRGDDEMVSMIDAQLASLNKNLNQVVVQDALTDFTVQAATKGTSASAKLSLLQKQITSADSNHPITIDGKDYASASEYWQVVLGNYLSGNGSGQFGDFFGELYTDMKNATTAATNRDGYPTNSTIMSFKNTFDQLAAKPEMAAYLDKLGQYQSAVMANAVDLNAKASIERAADAGTFQQADQNLAKLQNDFGINTDAYRLQLSANASDYISAVAQSQGLDPMVVAKQLGLSDLATKSFAIPGFETPKPGATTPGTTTPAASGVFAASAGYTGNSIVDFLTMSGQPTDFTSRSKLAAQYGITNYSGTAAQNTQLLSILKSASATAPTPTSPTEPFSPTAPIPSTPPAGGGGSSYVVASGDNLSTIAARNGMSLSQLLALNPQYAANPNLIRVGQVVNLSGAPSAPAPAPAPLPTYTPPTPTAPMPSSGVGAYTVVSGDNLSTIAARNGMSLSQLLALNPQYASNPNLIRPGDTVKLAGTSTPTPTPTYTAPVVNQPAPVVKAPTSPAPTPTSTPAPAPAPTNVYSGVSIVDYLSSTGKDTSFSYRSTLAAQYGITNYTGTAEQNTLLLKKLRGF